MWSSLNSKGRLCTDPRLGSQQAVTPCSQNGSRLCLPSILSNTLLQDSKGKIKYVSVTLHALSFSVFLLSHHPVAADAFVLSAEALLSRILSAHRWVSLCSRLSRYSGLIILAITRLPPGELEGINETVFAKHLESPGGKGTAVT